MSSSGDIFFTYFRPGWNHLLCTHHAFTSQKTPQRVISMSICPLKKSAHKNIFALENNKKLKTPYQHPKSLFRRIFSGRSFGQKVNGNLCYELQIRNPLGVVIYGHSATATGTFQCQAIHSQRMKKYGQASGQCLENNQRNVSLESCIYAAGASKASFLAIWPPVIPNKKTAWWNLSEAEKDKKPKTCRFWAYSTLKQSPK